MTRDQRAEILIRPLRIWAVLAGLVAANLIYANLPNAPFKPVVSFSIAIAAALLVLLLFMQLRKAAGIVRMAAIIGLTWATFLYLFALADFLTR